MAASWLEQAVERARTRNIGRPASEVIPQHMAPSSGFTVSTGGFGYGSPGGGFGSMGPGGGFGGTPTFGPGSPIGGVGSTPLTPPVVSDSGSGLGGTIGGWIGSAVDWAKQNPDLILGAIGAYQSAKDSREAKKLRDRAVKSAESDYESREPFRAALMEALANGSLRAPSSPSAPSQATAVRSLTGAEEAARKALTG